MIVDIIGEINSNILQKNEERTVEYTESIQKFERNGLIRVIKKYVTPIKKETKKPIVLVEDAEKK